MQQLTVRHKTTYRYRRPVEFGEHRVMVRPRDSHDLRLHSSVLNISPNYEIRWLSDVFNNSVGIVTFKEPAETLDLESIVVVDRYPFAGDEFPIEPFAQTIPFSYPAREIPDLGRTIERHHGDPDRKITDWARRFLSRDSGTTDTEEFLLLVSNAIRDEFEYNARYEPGVQSPVGLLMTKIGTCRDYALFMMEAVRSVGLAARFVSGYLYDPALENSPRPKQNTPQHEISGAGSTHAWVQIYLPGAGWVEFDPTNGLYGGKNLVPVAVAREPEQAMPISGTYDGSPEDFIDMAVSVTVSALNTLEDVA